MTVLVLEAGRQLDPKKDFREHTSPYELKYRGIAPGSLPGFGLEAKPDLAPHIAALVA
jgi:hypothetical protein